MDRTTQSSLCLTEASWEGRSKSSRDAVILCSEQYATQSEKLLILPCCALCTEVLQTGCNNMLPR